VLFITEMVLLPFFLRSAEHRKLYDQELSIWTPDVRAGMATLPAKLADMSHKMLNRFYGADGVIRAKFQDSVFVEKICACCGKGFLGEKLMRCKCGMIYYCGSDCQRSDWRNHKTACRGYMRAKNGVSE
jgi:MYND finger